MTRDPSRTYRRIWAAVERVPRGFVATYGQIAALARMPGQARLVGYALNKLPDGSGVPWHRIVNARGEISLRASSQGHAIQKVLLEREGVEIDGRGRIDLDRFRWEPGRRKRRGGR